MTVSAEMARNEKGDTRIDYSVGGAKRIRLWEPIGKAVLETTFRHDGAILLQQYVENGKIDGRIKETLAEAGCETTKDVAYKEVGFDKPCPWCGKHKLVRFVEGLQEQGRDPGGAALPLHGLPGPQLFPNR